MANEGLLQILLSARLNPDAQASLMTDLKNTVSKLEEQYGKLTITPQIDTQQTQTQLDKLTQQLKMFQEQAARNVVMGQTNGFDSSQLQAYDSAVKNLTVDTPNLKNRMQDLNSQYKDMSTQSKLAQTAHDNFMTSFMKDIGKFALWTVAATAVLAPIRQLQSGISFLNDLNTSMTNIQMITGMSSSDVQTLTKSYSDLASQLHETTSNMMAASEEFLRAGNSAQDTSKLLQASTVMSKIAGQSQADSAQSLISIMNAFHLTANDMMGVVDKMVAVDNTSATSTQELSEALQKTAASAQSAGVPLQTLISWIGEVSSVTRQSADTIGTAFNSIFSRYQNVAAGKFTDANGESLNNVETVLNKLGIAIRSSSGEFKSFDTVLSEVASKWSTYNSVQQAAIATAVAGTRQHNQFLVLMQNFSKTLDLQTTEADSAGNALSRYGTYAVSTQARIDDFTNAIQKMWMNALSSDTINKIIQFGTQMVNLADKIGLVNIALPILAGLISGVLTAGITGLIVPIGTLITEGITLNALMGGLPVIIGLIVTGLAAIVTPALTATNSLKQLNTQYSQINSTYQQSIKSANDVANSTNGQVKEAQNLASIIENLNKQETLNTDQKLEMKYAVDQLNSVLPNLNATIDSQTGKLSSNTSAIEKNIQALKDQAIATAYQAKAQAAATAYANEQDLIGKTKTQIDSVNNEMLSMQTRVAEGQAKIDALYKNGSVNNQSTAIDVLKIEKEYGIDTYNSLKKQLDQYNKSLDDQNAKLKEYDSQLTNDQTKAMQVSTQSAISQIGDLADINNASVNSSNLKISADSNFYNTVVTNNANLVNELSSAYGADYKNFKTFSDLKQQADALVTKVIGSNWATLYSSEAEALQAVIVDSQRDTEDSMLPDTSSGSKAQALLDAYKSAADAVSNYTPATVSSLGTDTGDYFANVASTTSTLSAYDKQRIKDLQAQKDTLQAQEHILDQQTQDMQNQLDALKKQFDLQNQASEREDLVNKVNEAQTELTNTQNEKNVQIWDGSKWISIADPEKVAQATSTLQDAQKALSDFDTKAAQQAQEDALQAQIDAANKQKQDLQNQENNISDQINTIQNGTSSSSSSSTPTSQIEYGSTGNDVSTLQTKLNHAGYNLSVDGVFGDLTKQAVESFQSKNNLSADGIVGSQTWGALSSYHTGGIVGDFVKASDLSGGMLNILNGSINNNEVIAKLLNGEGILSHTGMQNLNNLKDIITPNTTSNNPIYQFSGDIKVNANDANGFIQSMRDFVKGSSGLSAIKTQLV